MPRICRAHSPSKRGRRSHGLKGRCAECALTAGGSTSFLFSLAHSTARASIHRPWIPDLAHAAKPLRCAFLRLLSMLGQTGRYLATNSSRVSVIGTTSAPVSDALSDTDTVTGTDGSAASVSDSVLSRSASGAGNAPPSTVAPQRATSRGDSLGDAVIALERSAKRCSA